MIILEGPEGSGKTTLGNILKGVLDVDVLHEGGPPSCVEELDRRLEWQLSRRGNVLDRSPIVSERVYGPIVRGSMCTTDEHLDDYLRRFVADRWILIYCRPPVDVLLEHAERNLTRESVKKYYKTADHLATVIRRMSNVVERYDEVIRDAGRKGMTVLRYVRTESILR